MNYRDTLHAIDTAKALEVLGIPAENKGAYLKFPCPHCNEPALFKTYGDKKNLWYCPKCKKGGNLIKFTMEFKNLQWEPAKELLSKAIGTEAKTITEPLNITYALEYPKYLEDQGIPKALCDELEIGQPKGRTMLSGCIAFAVHNESGMKVAYYGIQMKDRKPKFHTSFNPENYLYNFHRIEKTNDLVVCTDLSLCVRAWWKANLPSHLVVSPTSPKKQIELLNLCKMLAVFRADTEIVRQVSAHYNGYVRFIG